MVAVSWVRPEDLLEGVDVLHADLPAGSRQRHIAYQTRHLAEGLAILPLDVAGPRREAGRAKILLD